MEIRNEIFDAIKKEIVGPSLNHFYQDEETGQEILLSSVHGSPKSRYGAGMLYPQQFLNKEIVDSGGLDTLESDGKTEENIEIPQVQKSKSLTESGVNDEEPVGLANQYLPSAMGFTIRFNANEENDEFLIQIKSAFYQKGIGKKPKKQIDKDGNIKIPTDKEGLPYESDYWIRRPINYSPISLKVNSLFSIDKKSHDIVINTNEKKEPWLIFRAFDRTNAIDEISQSKTFTFVILNNLKSETDDLINANKILFQNELSITTTNGNLIIPYKERESPTDTDEEKELNLLYRKKRIFSIGHGSSVEWEANIDNKTGREIVNYIKTSVIPSYDLPQVAPTSHVDLSMLELSDKGNWENAKKSLLLLINEYQEWILKIEKISSDSPELKNYREAAVNNVRKCKVSLDRIKKGIELLITSEEQSDLVKCFRWMNHAMIWQQQRSKTKIRKWNKKGSYGNQKLVLDGIDSKSDLQNFPSIEEYHSSSQYHGRWRPFQLAFIIMNIRSIVEPTSTDRKIVDLIWFPTGGGKTEAYLGLTAFNIFYRRIKGKEQLNWDLYGGTTVLMRYTLRLLTTQQYERAASLICACDLIRIKDNTEKQKNLEDGDLGNETISIGLWVGGSSTPNKNDEAKAQLNLLQRDPKAEYNFVVMKCPCCGAQIGKVENVGKNENIEKIKGIYKEDGVSGKVLFKCENPHCEYYNSFLPLHVIDELIYEYAPTLILGTVDKFAMIPWKPEAGNIFGFRKRGSNDYFRIHPPELIIQDELHLIAGPLGTMVGLFETLVQTLCNNYNRPTPPFISQQDKKFIPPKIVASSATISRAYEQVKSLYGIENRDQLSIFPAQGLSFGDTWFSEEKSLDLKDKQGLQKYPGRKYIGILASGFPSAQTSIVRTYASVLQKIKELEDQNPLELIDYYWTLLGFFNSIRELGGASSLVYGDIRERLGQIQNRDLISPKQKRYINKIEELTSRISSSEIPATLKKLETSLGTGKQDPLDICLATNMVATGVDISRLGLMFIHGHPKTTAEYIQASSRVGRELPKGPGIIFTLYSPSKPRDKSQYEQFQAYHSRIYSNVEPTSVTPFSINARERGIHSVIIGFIRHFSSGELKGSPIITEEFENLVSVISKILTNRCGIIDPLEVDNTLSLINKRVAFWKNGGTQSYGDAGNSNILRKDNYYPLMYASSAEVKEQVILQNKSLPTPTSMRGVDTESVIQII